MQRELETTYLEQYFSVGEDFAPRGHWSMLGAIFGCHNEGVFITGIWWEGAKHLMMHRAAPFPQTKITWPKS